MNGRVDILLDDPLTDEDGVFVIVSPPGHERHHDIASQGEFTIIRGWSIGDDIASLDPFPLIDDGLLVEAGILIGSLIFNQRVDIDTGIALLFLGVLALDDNPRCIDTLNKPGSPGNHNRTGIPGDSPLHAGPHQRNRLPLHVRSHQGSVRVIMLQKRNQCRGDAHQLVRRYIDHVDIRGNHRDKISAFPCRDQFALETSVGIHGLVGRRDDLVFLLDGGQILDFRQDPALSHHPIRRLDKAELVDPGVGAQGNDQSDVRTFRRLHGADSAIMGGVDIAHLKPGSFTGQSTRPQGGQPPLMSNLRQGIGLVHELRKLAAAEKLTHNSRDGLYIDEIMRHHRFNVLKAHFFLDRPFHPHQTDAVLILDQLSDGAHPPVAEMINIIHAAFRDAVFKIDEIFHGGHDVFVSQNGHIGGNIQTEFIVHLRPANRGKVVAVTLKKEAVEKLLRRIGRRRIAWSQTPVNLDDGVAGCLHPVNQQGVSYGGIGHILADLDDAQLPNSFFPDRIHTCGAQRLIATEDDFSRFRIQDIGRQNSSRQLLNIH
ncbi:MAG: hypothetical protein A4E72_01844 [Syntrophus sp. PtaU1.Bin208]|nr:MAG: hypothetical protein A4E72_01844 [Syntrophus sp. PtaU1.Bin208]